MTGTTLSRIRLRLRLAGEQGWRCAYCGCRMAFECWFYPDGATIDHLRTKASGGLLTYENCVAACRRCNSSRGTMDPMVFYLTRCGSTPTSTVR